MPPPRSRRAGTASAPPSVPEDISLLPETELRTYVSDDALDPSDPWTEHPLFGRAASRGAVSERRDWPIVVGGCHRSGTSLVRRILDAHPRIHCGPELTFFRDFYGDFRDDTLAHLRFARTARAVVPEDEALDVLGRAFVELHERAARRAGKPRWADKAPENVLYTRRVGAPAPGPLPLRARRPQPAGHDRLHGRAASL